jgi:hypothetical protein
MGFPITRHFRSQLALGNVPGHYPTHKFGQNTDLDTSEEDIWTEGGTWVAPTEARIHDIASADANDTDGGTGARQVTIWGLVDWDTAESSEVITMNGTGNVATYNSYVIIHRMKVTSTGGSGPNVGKISATAQTDGTVTAAIPAGIGQTRMVIYGIPSTQVALIDNGHITINRSSKTSGAVDFDLKVCPWPETFPSVFISTMTTSCGVAGSTVNHYPFKTPSKVSGPAIIKASGIGSTTDFNVSVAMDIVTVDNNLAGNPINPMDFS